MYKTKIHSNTSLDIYQHIFYPAESKKKEGRNEHINYENTPNA